MRLLSNENAFRKKAVQVLSQICFPPFCLHCDRILDEGAELVCQECHDQFEWIDPKTRCLYCFSSEVSSRRPICAHCFKQSPLLHRMGAVFENFGVAETLRREFKSGRSYLAKGIAGYMALQWGHLEWPIPDCVVPIPSSFSRRFERGYDLRVLIAEELAKILGRPMINALKRTSFETELPLFRRREKEMVEDKRILLVDDLIMTRETFKAGAKALLGASPLEIYGLAFCVGDFIPFVTHNFPFEREFESKINDGNDGTI